MSLDDFIIKENYSGSFSETITAQKKESNNLFTIIKIKKEESQEKIFQILKEGMNVLKNLNHPNIIKLIEWREDSKNYIAICKYCTDGNLRDYSEERKDPFSEEEVQFIMKQVVSAVKYLHDNKIIHRDITLNHLYIKYNSKEDKTKKNLLNSKIFLAGFELSSHFNEKEFEVCFLEHLFIWPKK